MGLNLEMLHVPYAKRIHILDLMNLHDDRLWPLWPHADAFRKSDLKNVPTADTQACSRALEQIVALFVS